MAKGMNQKKETKKPKKAKYTEASLKELNFTSLKKICCQLEIPGRAKFQASNTDTMIQLILKISRKD